MEQAKITFSMSVDGKTEAIFRADGKAGEGILAFPDGEGGGYRVDFDETALRIRRSGTAEMDFAFRTGSGTAGVLTTAGTTFRVSLSTRLLRVRSDRIELEYDLEEEGRRLSRHRMTIEWK